ncbi:MAG: ATP-dependent sacrificial sulfur transferase LarE [bacterium JZ-2024 1]
MNLRDKTLHRKQLKDNAEGMQSELRGIAGKNWGRLVGVLARYPDALVAFSGGLDSSFLLFACHRVLGERVLGVMVLSPAVPAWDIEHAQKMQADFGVKVRFVSSRITQTEAYAQNSPLRCYYCKTDLYQHLQKIREREGWSIIFNGTVLDDFGDYRPGLRAARQAHIVSPLVEAGLRKEDIRMLARAFHLPFHDRPASPCLASRIPFGTRVTVDILLRVQSAESALHALGLSFVRVRHLGDSARVELGEPDWQISTSPHFRHRIVEEVQKHGYHKVVIERYQPSGTQWPGSKTS